MNKTMTSEACDLPKLATGIVGFDLIALGGVPEGRSTIVSGSAGSGKTLFGLQFLVGGVTKYDQPGVLVTFEEHPDDLMRNVLAFGWDMRAMMASSKLAVVDATPDEGETHEAIGQYDLSALVARIEDAVRRTGAKRLVLDSVGSLFTRFGNPDMVRREMHRIILAMRRLSVTTVLNVERTEEYGTVSRFGVEEFVADNVLILRNALDSERRRRTIEILKFRGANHQKGEYPYTIDSSDGISILPLSSIELNQASSGIREGIGNKDIDRMCGGGMFRDSVILVSGATGTGKTLLVAEFAKAAIEAGQRVIVFAFEESPQQITRYARGIGIEFDKAQEAGLLKIVSAYPETTSLEDHFVRIKRDVEEFGPSRIAIDSLSALERISTPRAFREFAIGITSYLKHLAIPGMLTNTTSLMVAADTVTEASISTITDMIILLRYVEVLGQMRRCITILKMRGSAHEKSIREYVINSSGYCVMDVFGGGAGMLSGSATSIANVKVE